MKRETILEGLTKVLKLEKSTSFETAKPNLLKSYIVKNKTENDIDFYKDFKEEFSWIDYALKINEAQRLKRIDNHLMFFKVITIIGIVLSILIALGSS